MGNTHYENRDRKGEHNIIDMFVALIWIILTDFEYMSLLNIIE